VNNKTSIILPVAGKSSRFPNMKPKWLLTHPSGNLMFVQSLLGLDMKFVDRVYLVVLREHIDSYISEDDIAKAFELGNISNYEIVIVEEPTNNQPETVAAAIERCNISGGVYIKDSDNFFEDTPQVRNSISVANLKDFESINASNKSYIVVDHDGFVLNIVEKKIVSPTFCVGGYSFLMASEFLEHFHLRNPATSDFYISHIVFSMILKEFQFLSAEVRGFSDWGTIEDWNKYKDSFATLFVDIDGVLVENSSQYFDKKWGDTDPIVGNVNAINKLYSSGRVRVILTTSRSSRFKAETVSQLLSAGVGYDDIIFDLPHAKRVIVNDYSNTNRFKSCEAINIVRDSECLGDMLLGMF
jgi:hypothetical protein